MTFLYIMLWLSCVIMSRKILCSHMISSYCITLLIASYASENVQYCIGLVAFLPVAIGEIIEYIFTNYEMSFMLSDREIATLRETYDYRRQERENRYGVGYW